MQLKTILNRVQKHSSFVYEEARFVEGAVPALEIDLRPRANSRATCSGCGRRGPTYDRLVSRRVEIAGRDGNHVLVRGALSDGELVVTTRFAEIGPGVAVEVR